MSTILEALKKSEQERKLNDIPTLSDMPTPQEPARWPLLVLAVIVLVLLVVMGLVIKQLWFSPAADTHQSTINQSTTELSEPAVPTEQTIVVNVVSYSDIPEKRFIMIDGKLVRENEFVRAGLKVDEIRPNEVVFNLRGKKIIRKP